MVIKRLAAPGSDIDSDAPPSGMAWQRVSLRRREAWLIPGVDTENHRILVTIPAFGGSRARLQEVWMGQYWQAALAAGFSVLALPDFTVPTTESAIQYLQSHYENPYIGLQGFSIGASVAAYAASRHPVSALVADGLADNLFQAILLDFRKQVLLRLLGPSIQVNVRYSRRIPATALKGFNSLLKVSSDCPILLVYGDEEPIMTQPLNTKLIAYAEATKRAQLWIIPAVGHCQGATTKPTEYIARIAALH